MGGRRKSKLIPEVLAQVVRQPDETSEQFRLRYNREKRRAYRAMVPKGPKRLRGPDKQLRKNAAPPEIRAALECLPGETEQERKRRYQRLLVRHWRSRIENGMQLIDEPTSERQSIKLNRRSGLPESRKVGRCSS